MTTSLSPYFSLQSHPLIVPGLKRIHRPSSKCLFRKLIPNWDHPISQEVMPYVNSCASVVNHSRTERLTHHPLTVSSRCDTRLPWDDVTMPPDRLEIIPSLKNLNKITSRSSLTQVSQCQTPWVSPNSSDASSKMVSWSLSPVLLLPC